MRNLTPKRYLVTSVASRDDAWGTAPRDADEAAAGRKRTASAVARGQARAVLDSLTARYAAAQVATTRTSDCGNFFERLIDLQEARGSVREIELIVALRRDHGDPWPRIGLTPQGERVARAVAEAVYAAARVVPAPGAPAPRAPAPRRKGARC